MAQIPYPPQFLERMSRFLGDEFPAFAESLAHDPVHGLRVNTLKISADEFRKISPFPLGDKVAWCDSAFLLEASPLQGKDGRKGSEPGKHPYHLGGLYYLQDPSAMSAAELLAPRPGERILDLAASPGGKTTHIASLLQGQGLLIANEIKTKRLNHLVVNVERWGAANVVVTNETPERLADHFGAFFDRVIVDAPCSGEGTFRKDPGARLEWSEEMLIGCSLRQVNILRVAAHLVRPGGTLLYSTCTFAPEENESVVHHFLQEHPAFDVEALPKFPGFMPGRPDWLDDPEPEDEVLQGAVRLFPHRLRGEGHFACLFHRGGGTTDERVFPLSAVKVPAPEWKLWQAFLEQTLKVDFPPERFTVFGERLYLMPEDMPDMRGLRVALPGVRMGTFKKERFEPSHSLALFLHPGQAKAEMALSKDSREVTVFMRGESIPSSGDAGWTLVTVDGWPIGWGKRVQGVIKNHIPHGWLVAS
jgi:NOL1/NOP2/sun family putative RNA methylase